MQLLNKCGEHSMSSCGHSHLWFTSLPFLVLKALVALPPSLARLGTSLALPFACSTLVLTLILLQGEINLHTSNTVWETAQIAWTWNKTFREMPNYIFWNTFFTFCTYLESCQVGRAPRAQLIVDVFTSHNMYLVHFLFIQLKFQIGLTEKGTVFVILGSNRIQPECFAEFTPKELKKCKVRCDWILILTFNTCSTACTLGVSFQCTLYCADIFPYLLVQYIF